MKRILPIIVIVALVGVLIGLNCFQPGYRDLPPDTPPSSSSTTHAAALPKHVLSQDVLRDMEPAPEEIIINNPASAHYRITIGWDYDNSNQSDDLALLAELKTAQAVAQGSHGAISLQAVDVDIPNEDRSPATQGITDLGIAVNGQYTYSAAGKSIDLSDNPGSRSAAPADVKAALSEATGSPHG